MATSGVDRYLKVWDLRNTCRELVRYKLEAAARDLCFSQRHYLAAAVGNIVQVEHFSDSYSNCILFVSIHFSYDSSAVLCIDVF